MCRTSLADKKIIANSYHQAFVLLLSVGRFLMHLKPIGNDNINNSFIYMALHTYLPVNIFLQRKNWSEIFITLSHQRSEQKMNRPTKSEREKQNSLPEDINKSEYKPLRASSFRSDRSLMMKIVTSLVESEDFCLDLKLGGDYHCNTLWEISKANSAARGPAQPTGESGGRSWSFRVNVEQIF